MERRVAITGMGLICALGNTVAEAYANAYAGTSGIRNCDRYMWGEYGKDVPIRVAGTVEGFDPSVLIPEKFVDRYDPTVCFALGATKEALTDSGIDFDEALRDRTAVMIGTASGGATTIHRACHMIFAEKRCPEVPGYMMMQCSGNMPSGLVSMYCGFRGPNLAVVNACASSGTALGLASDYIRNGRADVVVTGGTEASITPGLYASLANAKAINPTADPVRAIRPFAGDRGGLVMGEGCGVFILEPLDDA